ncbi:MAG: PDZ domain-containing protein [Paludibacteraceae bacterium]|nr:PDZ domain-containing protein [Paludibacteraceae bacterium]
MKKYIIPTLTIACLLLGFLLGNAISNKAAAQRFYIHNGQIFSSTSKIDQLLQLMQSAYVEEIDTDSITDEVMQDLVQKLDPHSAYIPKKDLEIVNSELSASFSGIGVQFNIQNDTVHIVAVISGGPSEGVGILAGDKIVEVDDSTFVGKRINNEKVMHTLRGEKGTQVTLGIKRSGTPETLYYTVTRGDIPVHSVDAKFIIPIQAGGVHHIDKIGFVRVNKFGENTYDEFISALATLKMQGAKGYIVDLRENSGGFMDQAIRMANEFLESGEMIVYSEGRAYPKYEARANGAGRFKQVPLIVLIDDFSASASEIFSGAMQDNDRAQIIGRRSFGKGLVQQQLPFPDGSAVRLTVARYYTPSGRCIQKPYKLGEQDDYQKELLERFERGEFYNADSVHLQDSTLYFTKSGRVVYGGGGIMPDIFVGRDTTLNTPYYNRCVNLAYTYQFAYRYTDAHRKQLSLFKDWKALEKHLLGANWLPEFIAFAKEKGIEPDKAQIEKSRPLLTRLINAYIVRNILGDEGFFPLFERDDEITKKAVEVMSRM